MRDEGARTSLAAGGDEDYRPAPRLVECVEQAGP